MRNPFARDSRDFLFEMIKNVNYGDNLAAHVSGDHIQRLALDAFANRWNELNERFNGLRELDRAAYPGCAPHSMTFIYSEEVRKATAILGNQRRRPNEAGAYRTIARELVKTNRKQFNSAREIGAYTMSQVVSHVEGKYNVLRLECNPDAGSASNIKGLCRERRAYLEAIGQHIGSSSYAVEAVEQFGENPTLPLARIPYSVSRAVEETGVMAELAQAEGITNETAATSLSGWFAHVVQLDLDLIKSSRPDLDNPIVLPPLEFRDVPVQLGYSTI